MLKIAVVGAGIFGCTTALELRKRFPNSKIEIFEKNSSILSGASHCNQYRLHRGYHYPRSKETVSQQLESVLEFEHEFKNAVYDFGFNRYYGIAKEGSLVNEHEYINFLELNELEYKIVNDVNIPVNYEKINVLLQVKENSYDLGQLYLILIERLRKSKIKINNNTTFLKSNLSMYDLVINATYSQINELLDEDTQMDFQFELVEKPVIYTPKNLKNTSIVIMDGEFCCVDPKSKYESVLGHVREAIHETQIGKRFECPDEYKEILNSGIVKSKLSKSEQIIKSCSEYFNFGNELLIPETTKGSKIQLYKGSMFTIRTVLPNRDHDDARPSSIIKHTDQFYSIFGGKVGTSVTIAKELIKQL